MGRLKSLSRAYLCDLSGVVPYIFLLLLVGCSSRPLYPLPGRRNDRNKQPLQTFRVYNIAHRGSNGEIPEETAAAYMRAIEEGADFIETDILASEVGAIICFRDCILDDTTDIANHKELADRKRTYEVQGVNTTGYFLVDFTLEELKLLRVKQRYPFRDQQYNEYVLLENQLGKWPGGKKFEDKFVETLKKYGYKGSYMSKQWLKQPAFIQSFAPTSLVYISNQTDLPKIFLIDDTTMPTQDTNQSYWEITSDSYLDFIKEYVVGIGPWKDTIVPVSRNYLDTPSDLVARAHARNLQVHPYTFRNENKFLHFNFSEDPYNEYDYWINKIGVDGLFTDFTGSLHQYQEWTNPYASGEKEVTRLLHKIELMLSKFKYVTSVKLYLTLSDQGNAIYWSVYIIGFPIYIYQNKNRFQHIVAGARRFLKRLDPLDLSPAY